MSESPSATKPGVRILLVILWRVIMVVVLLGGGIAVMQHLAAMKQEPRQSAATETSPMVSTVPLQRTTIPVILSGFGPVRSGRTVQLAPEIAGRIVWRADLDPGDTVAAESPVIRIDDRDFRLAIAATEANAASVRAEQAQARVQLESARSTLEQRRERAVLSTAEADRLAALLQKDQIGTQSAADAARRAALVDREAVTATEELIAILPHRIEAADASLARLTAQADLDRMRLARCELRTPFAGRVAAFSIEIGAYAAPGVPLLTLVDDSDREIAVQLRADEVADFLKFTDGRAVDSSGGWYGALAEATVEIQEPASGGNLAWRGTVDRIGAVDPGSRMVELIVRPVNGADRPLPVGTFCEVRIPGKAVAGVAIPRRALRADNVVFVLKDGRLAMRAIRVLHVDGDILLVDGELQDGESLIVSRINAPVRGMQLRDAAEAANSGSVGPAAEVP